MTDIKISASEHAKMMRQIAKLYALEAGGVDNWEWYDESLKCWNYENELAELSSEMIDSINDFLAEADVDQPAGTGCGYSITFDEEFMTRLLVQYGEAFCAIKTKVTL